VLAAPFALSHSAAAQPVTGPYIAAGGGYNVESAQKAKNVYLNSQALDGKQDINLKNGYTGDASIGYGFGNGVRVEIEGDYIHDNFGKTKYNGTTFYSGGHEARYGVFGNVLYDMDVGLPYLYPYVGVGVGYQDDALHQYDNYGTVYDKTKGTLAYQGIAGVAFPIAMVPGLSLTAEYRLVGLLPRKFNGGNDIGFSTFKAEDEFNNQVQVGLRYQLFTPAPMAPAPTPAPVAAAPAPAAAKTYLVFFDWDKYNLTPRATDIIAQAASDSHTQNVTTLSVSGYTDTSGTPTYNQGLSERRAKAVAAQLVTDGVPQNEIEIHAYGETHLLVPTGPGVREPQNRRVEIILH
jgi:OOP family OmpA-OmpF porin